MRLLTTLFLPATLTAAINVSFFCKTGNPGAVYYCSDAHFKGICTYRMPNNECFAPEMAPQSIGPDKGGYCVLFEDRECKGSIIIMDGKDGGNNRLTCPGAMTWPQEMPKVGSMKCHAGS